MPNQSSKTKLIPCRLANDLVEFVDLRVKAKRDAGQKWSRSEELESCVRARWLRWKETQKDVAK